MTTRSMGQFPLPFVPRFQTVGSLWYELLIILDSLPSLPIRETLIVDLTAECHVKCVPELGTSE
jgi:hypothetical protein